VQGTHGAELHAGLAHDKITEVFHKGADRRVDSYSGFFDNGRKKQTGLAEWLRERWITRVYVMGLATDYCVKATALDARELGFETWVIEDGCRAVELAPGDGERAIAAMRDAGATIVESGSIGA
jgi:nicotinamidase/pyrazinamidase